MAMEIAPDAAPDNPALTLLDPTPATAPSTVPVFLMGTLVGGLAGALLATALSPYTRAYLVGLYQLVLRRVTSAERDKLRFELLLQ
ncbi:MAG: hypothetical protein QM692_04685 [Thermomicrobiales bacterium]